MAYATLSAAYRRYAEFRVYEAIDIGANELVSLCAFKNRESADGAARATAALVKQSLAEVFSDPPEMILAETKLRSSRLAEAGGLPSALHAVA